MSQLRILPPVVAIIVSYHPQPEQLLALLHVLSTQTQHIVLVDNGGHYSLSSPTLPSHVTLLTRHKNEGVATALNLGIAHVKTHYPHTQFILTMDQDSLPAADMVENLCKQYQQLSAQGIRVGALGPQQLDSRSGRAWPFIAPVGKRRQWIFPPLNGVVIVDHLITSGCLIPLNILEEVGTMEDRLFIDYVDIEWSLRCRAYGYHLYAVANAHLHHTLGDHLIRIFRREIALHSPLRHYYCTRNALLLWRHRHIPWYWKVHDGLRVVKKIIFWAIFTHQRPQHWRMMSLGLWHGIINRGGKL